MDMRERSRSLSETRRNAEKALEGPLRTQADLLAQAFALFDVCGDRLVLSDTDFGRVCALVSAKARSLALGCYSLALDGLAQESGALARPLFESLELLEYLRRDPKRAQEVIENRQPSAGIIARRIEGKFQELREHFNQHASHLSLALESIRHLVNFQQGGLRTVLPNDERVLRANLNVLIAVICAVLRVAVDCLAIAQGRAPEDLAAAVLGLSQRAYANSINGAGKFDI
jgi:hypothetical protein